MGAGAPGTLNFDPTAGQLPPQAPSPTPTAEDAVVPAQTAQDVVRTAAYGDTGAQQYQALVAAGQPPAAAPLPPTASPLSSMVGAPPPRPMPPGMGASPTDPIANALIALGGGKPEQLDAQRLAEQQHKQAMQIQQQQFVQTQAKADFDFLNSMKKVAPQYRSSLAIDYFHNQGRAIPASVAQMLTDQSVLAHMTSADIDARIQNDPSFAMMYFDAMDKPKEFLTLHDDITKAHSEAQKAISDAERAHVQAQYAGQEERDKANSRAAEIAMRVRQAQRPPTLPELQALDSAGWASWSVPMPGGPPGSTMWMAGPKSQMPRQAAALDPRAIEEQQAQAKQAPMTIQKAREMTASSKNVAADILAKLDDPAFAEAKKVLGPDLSTSIGGVSIGVPKTNLAYRNYRDFGGQGNTPEVNKLMEAIGYYQGTGFQAFLNGIRNKQIVDEIRVHIPQPYDTEDQIRSKVAYLDTRYNDVLNEYEKGAGTLRSLKAANDTTTTPTTTGGGEISAQDFLAQ